MQLDVATNWVTAAKAMHLTRLSPINKKLTKKVEKNCKNTRTKYRPVAWRVAMTMGSNKSQEWRATWHNLSETNDHNKPRHEMQQQEKEGGREKERGKGSLE